MGGTYLLLHIWKLPPRGNNKLVVNVLSVNFAFEIVDCVYVFSIFLIKIYFVQDCFISLRSSQIVLAAYSFNDSNKKNNLLERVVMNLL